MRNAFRKMQIAREANRFAMKSHRTNTFLSFNFNRNCDADWLDFKSFFLFTGQEEDGDSEINEKNALAHTNKVKRNQEVKKFIFCCLRALHNNCIELALLRTNRGH